MRIFFKNFDRSIHILFNSIFLGTRENIIKFTHLWPLLMILKIVQQIAYVFYLSEVTHSAEVVNDFISAVKHFFVAIFL